MTGVPYCFRHVGGYCGWGNPDVADGPGRAFVVSLIRCCDHVRTVEGPAQAPVIDSLLVRSICLHATCCRVLSSREQGPISPGE